MSSTPRPCVAAISLDVSGGGVSAVSRLVHQALQDHSNKPVRSVTLQRGSHAPGTPSTAARLWFGARMATLQATGTCEWIFYTHLSVARVQRYVPKAIRRPYAVFLHGVEVWRRLTPAQEEILTRATLRIANSDLTARRVGMMHPNVGRVDHCPLSLARDHASHDVSSRPLSFPLGPHAVILVARMSSSERYKGHDELLRAWPAVRARIGDAELVFAGSGDDVPRLRRKAQTLGIADSVVFTGFVPDEELRALYARAAVFAMPSRGEGFGLVYLEAMAAGLPCIGSTADAANEIIDDGVTGFLVEQSDRDGLADRLIRLLSDPEARREMGANGARRVRETFSYSQFSSRLVGLVDQAFSRSTRSVVA